MAARMSLKQNIIVFALIENIARLMTGIDALCKKFSLTSFGLLTCNTLLILDLFQTIKLLTFEFIEFGNDVSESSVDSWNDN